MKQILTSIPLFVSTIALFFFFFLPDKRSHTVRFVPYILLSIIARSIYLIIVYYKSYFTPNYDIVSPPFTILSLSLIYLFLLDILNDRKISPFIINLNLFPTIIGVVLYLLIILSPELHTKLDRINYVSKNLMGFILTCIYFISIYIKQFSADKIEKHHKLISLVLLQLGVIFFLYAFFFLYVYKEKVFVVLPIQLLKLVEISLALTFYFYIFNIYNKHIKLEKEKRLEGFFFFPDQKQHILSEFNQNLAFEQKQKRNIKELKNQERSNHSYLSDEELNYYRTQIEDYFSEPENYINPDFTQKKLAKHLNVPRYYISQVFNIGMNITFSDYLNIKRITYACEIISKNKNISITQLAEKVGYRSRTSFYTHFERIVKCSPRDFFDKLHS